VLKPTGRIVLVEHVRDFSNLWRLVLVLCTSCLWPSGLGVPRKSNLKIAKQYRITPLVAVLELCLSFPSQFTFANCRRCNDLPLPGAFLLGAACLIGRTILRALSLSISRCFFAHTMFLTIGMAMLGFVCLFYPQLS
jgi:hypothetical protein